MAKHAGLPWDAVLTAELFGRFKPDPAVYQGAARLLGLAPAQVLIAPGLTSVNILVQATTAGDATLRASGEHDDDGDGSGVCGSPERVHPRGIELVPKN